MSETAVEGARRIFAEHKAAMSGKVVTDFKIVPAYGFTWTQDGKPNAARIGWISNNNADSTVFINEWNRLVSESTTQSGKGLTASAAGGILQNIWNMPYVPVVLGGVLLWFVWKKFFKKRRRK